MNNMIDLDLTIVFQLVNFLITIVVLNFLLIKPVRDQINARQALMSSHATEIEKFTSQASSKLSQYEASLKEARAIAAQAREEIKSEGYSTEQEIASKSHAETQAFLQAAREQIQAEASTAKQVLLSQVDSFATKAVNKILG